ncbi:hypothetical protein HK098_006659 [Nowakowskiella sp. JEL0407]|nr:hypothetical protein HK098_006659 [Nowakowskiella sp. JEL0407]
MIMRFRLLPTLLLFNLKAIAALLYKSPSTPLPEKQPQQSQPLQLFNLPNKINWPEFDKQGFPIFHPSIEITSSTSFNENEFTHPNSHNSDQKFTRRQSPNNDTFEITTFPAIVPDPNRHVDISTSTWFPPKSDPQQQHVEDQQCSGEYYVNYKNLTGGGVPGESGGGMYGVISDNSVMEFASRASYSGNLNCKWRIEGPVGFVVVLTFRIFDTECGWDFVNIWDGPETFQTQELAQLCGTRQPLADKQQIVQPDIIISQSNFMSVSFDTDSDVNGKGFIGVFRFVDPLNYCSSDSDCGGGNVDGKNAGKCVKNVCECSPFRSGMFCQNESTNYGPFSARQFHSATYDSTRDVMYVFGGRTSQNQQILSELNDLLIYDFKTNEWSIQEILNPQIRPSARYNHFAWMVKGKLVIYGGNSIFRDTNDVWVYDPDRNMWLPLNPIGSRPPPLFGASAELVYRTSSKPVPPQTSASLVFNGLTGAKIYVYGGYDPQNQVLSRQLYVFDIDQLKWLAASPNSDSMYGGIGIYHDLTRSIYFFGGFRLTPLGSQKITTTYRYDIDENLWYKGDISNTPDVQMQPNSFNPIDNGSGGLPSQSLAKTRSFAAAILVGGGTDQIVLFGGQTASSVGLQLDENVCFSYEIQVYDIACGIWTYSSLPILSSKQRMGHAMILRDSMLIITGGSNGMLQNDMFAIDLFKQPLNIRTLKNETLPKRDACRASTWCDIGHYDCTDCMSRSFCNWCGTSNTCTYNTNLLDIGKKSGTSTDTCSNGLLTTNRTMCPIRIQLDWKGELKFVLEPGEVTVFKTYIDDGESDITLKFINMSDPNLKLFVNLISIHPPISGVSPEFSIPATDPRRYAGFYLFEITNLEPNPQISFFTTLDLQKSSDTRPVDGTDPDSSRRPRSLFDFMDLTTFAGVFAISMAVSLCITWLIKRTRDRVALLRQIRRGEVIVPPVDPPKLYKVKIDLKNVYGRVNAESAAKEIGRQVPESPKRFLKLSLPSASKQEEKGKRKRQTSNKIEMDIMKTAELDSAENQKFNFLEGTIPLSLESIPPKDNSQPALVAVNFIVVLPSQHTPSLQPDSTNSVSRLPPCAIGTSFFTDPAATRQYHEENISKPTSSSPPPPRPSNSILSRIKEYWKDVLTVLVHNPETHIPRNGRLEEENRQRRNFLLSRNYR